jgi:hypothetical protein
LCGRKRDIFTTFKDFCHKDSAGRKPNVTNLSCLALDVWQGCQLQELAYISKCFSQLMFIGQ